jgi:hypothetical protein
MSHNATIKQQAKSGFRRAGGWLLGIAWFGLVIWGMINAFGTEANFSESHHPSRVVGYFLLSIRWDHFYCYSESLEKSVPWDYARSYAWLSDRTGAWACCK